MEIDDATISVATEAASQNHVYESSSQATRALLSLLNDVESHIEQQDNAHPDSTDRILMMMEKATTLLLKLKQSQRSLGLAVSEENDTAHLKTVNNTDSSAIATTKTTLTNQVQISKLEVERQALALQNLIYERNHLRSEIGACKQLQSNYLFKMALEEQEDTIVDNHFDDNDINDEGKKKDINIDATEKDIGLSTSMEDGQEEGEEEGEEEPKQHTTSTSITNAKQQSMTQEEKDAIIDAFLSPPPPSSSTSKNSSVKYSHRDPSKHAYNLSKMHHELTNRGKLQKDLANAIQEKQILVDGLKEKQIFLKKVPEKLNSLETATKPLQDYFLKHRVVDLVDCTQDGDDDLYGDIDQNMKKRKVVKPITREMRFMGSIERKKRLELASTLPGPLYTLFVQFQSYFDANGGDSSESSNIVTIDDSGKEIEDKSVSNGGSTAQFGERLSILDIKKNTTSSSSAATAVQEDQDNTTMDNLLERGQQALQVRFLLPNILSQLSKSSSTTIAGEVKLQFEYLPKLQIVTVHVVGIDSGEILDQNTDVQSNTLDKKIVDLLFWGTNDDRSNINGSDFASRQKKRLLLLENLFDEDDGKDLPDGSAVDAHFSMQEDGTHSVHNDEEEEEEGPDDSPTSPVTDQTRPDGVNRIRQALRDRSNIAKPYKWCQHLAGLYYPNNNCATSNSADEAPKKYSIEPSTKAVMEQLHRRIRSHSTLSVMLSYLEKNKPNPIPLHPSLQNDDSEDVFQHSNMPITAKLHEWTEDVGPKCMDENNGDKSCTYFVATIKRQTATLRASVKIDVRYPAVPPLWSLQPDFPPDSTKTWADEHGNIQSLQTGVGAASSPIAAQLPPLYDSTLSTIESHVNAMTEELNLFSDDIEESFDWILMHQLRWIILSWDESEQALAGAEKNDKQNNAHMQTDFGESTRTRKGRDRLPLSFNLYCSGL